MEMEKVRRPWAELVVGIISLAVLAIAPVSISWVGIVAVIVAVVSTLVTLVAARFSSRWQVILLFIGIVLTAAGIWYGIQHESDTDIFSLALLWIVGSGLVLSSFLTLLCRIKG